MVSDMCYAKDEQPKEWPLNIHEYISKNTKVKVNHKILIICSFFVKGIYLWETTMQDAGLHCVVMTWAQFHKAC